MSDLKFLCEECHINLHCSLKGSKMKKKNPKKVINSCQNCYFSQIMVYKGQKRRSVLWCNFKCEEC